MELREMEVAALEERKNAILGELDVEGADLNALEAEMKSINEEMERRKAEEAKRNEIRAAVANGAGTPIENPPQTEERKIMKNSEVIESRDYINAFAEYIKSEDDSECRSLLTENVSGTVPVPAMVYDIVKNAWEREGLMSRVKKAYLKGNVKVGFEISATGAVKHTEGSGAVSEETLTLGTVEIKPVSIKKWISISDEVNDLRGEEFLQYIYDELTYQIAKKAADEVVAQIEACGTVATTTCVGVPVVTSTQVSVGLVAEAMAKLSDQAANPVVILNKATWGEFKKAQYANKFNTDPFEGLPVIFNNTIESFANATTGVTYAIVGDLGEGALANFPNGEGVEIKVDDKTDMAKDLVKILGREYVAVAPIANRAFVNITKPAAV